MLGDDSRETHDERSGIAVVDQGNVAEAKDVSVCVFRDGTLIVECRSRVYSYIKVKV